MRIYAAKTSQSDPENWDKYFHFCVCVCVCVFTALLESIYLHRAIRLKKPPCTCHAE